MILRFDSGFDSTFFGFKIRFEDSAESSNLKIRESYVSTKTEFFVAKVVILTENRSLRRQKLQEIRKEKEN